MAGLKPRKEAVNPLDDHKLFGGLTGKQEAYCQLRFGGATQVEAYVEAYDVGTDNRGVHYNLAHQLEETTKISARLKQMEKKRDEGTSLLPRISKTFIVEGITQLALNAKTDNVKLRAFELLGKMAGMDLFRDIKVIESKPQTVEDIDRELKERLGKLKVIEGTLSTLEPARNPKGSPGVGNEWAGRDRRRKPTPKK